MPISKPDHVQVHRIEFAKGTNLPRLIDEAEKTIQGARYASYAAVGVAGLGVAGAAYGLYKIAQAIGGAWEDFDPKMFTTPGHGWLNVTTGEGEDPTQRMSDVGIFFPFNQIPGLTWLP
jgi:hypothetical protein